MKIRMTWVGMIGCVLCCSLLPPGASGATNVARYTFNSGVATSSDSHIDSTASDFEINPVSGWDFSETAHNVYAQSTATTNSEADAVVNGDYFSFTITPAPYTTLDLLQLDFTTIHNATSGGAGANTNATMKFFVRSSVDGFTANIGSTYTQAWDTTTARSISLPNTSFSDVATATEFRLYIYDSGVDIIRNGARLDNVTLVGELSNPIARFQEGVYPAPAYTTDCTWIHQGSPNNNWDGHGSLSAGINDSSQQTRTLLEFDINAMTPAYEIYGIELVMTGRGVYEGTNTYNLHEYGYDIVETNATWNAPASGDGAGATLGTLLSSTAIDTGYTNAVATFTNSPAFIAAVSDALADDGVLRMILVDVVTDPLVGGNRLVSLVKDEDVGLSGRPYLRVVYRNTPSGTVISLR